MIFVCVGSREYQFDRLLEAIDYLIETKTIKEEVFAQIGQSNYIPKFYKYKRFLSVDEFKSNQKKADLIISHGGTGALIGALKEGKQVISTPRLAKFGEHTDDHQIQVSSVLSSAGYLKMVTEMENLKEAVISIKESPITKRYNRPSNVVNIIRDYINQL